MSTVDCVLLGVLTLSALLGALRGFVAEVLSLVVWVAAFWLAFAYGADVANMFVSQIHDPAARLFAAYALVFIAAMIVGGMVTWLVGKLVRSVGLGGIDRLFGLLFGCVRGVALGCVLVLVLGFTTLPQQPQWRASPLVPEFQRGAEWITHWLPATAASHVSFDAVAEQGKKNMLQAVSERVLSEQVLQASPAQDFRTEEPEPGRSASAGPGSKEASTEQKPARARSKHHRKN